MACHLTGTIWIPQESFWEDLFKTLSQDSQFADIDDMFVVGDSLDFGGADSLADEGCFTGIVINAEDASLDLSDIPQDRQRRFQVGLELIWKLCEDFGLSIGRHEAQFGVPRLSHEDIEVDVVVNSENARGTIAYEEQIRPQWEGGKPIPSMTYNGPRVAESLKSYRLQAVGTELEQAFLESWDAANAHSDILTLITEVRKGNGKMAKGLGTISDRDRTLAATLMQWLGTNVGQGVIRNAESRYQAQMQDRPGNGAHGNISDRDRALAMAVLESAATKQEGEK